MVRFIIDLPADSAPGEDVVYHFTPRKCALEGCTRLVNPIKKGNRFCSEKCRMTYHNQQRKFAPATP